MCLVRELGPFAVESSNHAFVTHAPALQPAMQLVFVPGYVQVPSLQVPAAACVRSVVALAQIAAGAEVAHEGRASVEAPLGGSIMEVMRVRSCCAIQPRQ